MCVNQGTEEVQHLAMCLFFISRHEKGGMQGRWRAGRQQL